MKRKILTNLIVVTLVMGLAIGVGMAQTQNIPKVGLVLDKDTYAYGEKIRMVLTLGNAGGEIITTKGFMARPFHLFLTFTDPDGLVINSYLLKDTPLQDPPPPGVSLIARKLEQAEAIERILTAWAWENIIPNAHDYYTLTKPGKYTVKAQIPHRRYPLEAIINQDYAKIGFHDWQGALESRTAFFNILPEGTASGNLTVRVAKHTVGGGNQPGSTKEPLSGVLIKVFKISEDDICMSSFGSLQYGYSWHNYDSMWSTCAPAASGTTAGDNEPMPAGTVSFSLEPGNYIVIGQYDPDTTPNSGDEILMGVSAEGLDSGETMNKYLQVLVKSDGKKVPAKYTVITGSELMIIEPEYIEWDGTQELYPFVFQGVGDWGVTTSVTPPEGFVADHNSLSTEVISEVKVLQFIITDVGSKWEHTKVDHRIKHKGNSQTIRSKVGIKLSERLSKKKGIDTFGEESHGK